MHPAVSFYIETYEYSYATSIASSRTSLLFCWDEHLKKKIEPEKNIYPDTTYRSIALPITNSMILAAIFEQEQQQQQQQPLAYEDLLTIKVVNPYLRGQHFN